MMEFNELTKTAIETAKIAGEILRKGFGTHFCIESKEGKNNLVTEYDRLSESAILSFIKGKYPNHSFLAEESGESGNAKHDDVMWVIDPLDGTVNFAHALPVFSVSIAAVKDNKILSGVVYHPILDELFVAENGNGAFLNGKKISVSTNNDMETSFLVTGFPYNVNENPNNCIDHFVSIIQKGIPIRRLGSAALDLAYVACGRFDGFWEINLHPWDVAAGVLLVQEAGGNVTQYSEKEYNIFNNSILATNGMIHKVAAKSLQASYKGI